MMEACCSRFTPAEGGARLAAAAFNRNTLAVEYASFIATRLIYEDAYKIRGLLSEGRQRSIYVTRASLVGVVGFELGILTELTIARGEKSDAADWKGVLEKSEVLVCTSEVLERILKDNILTMININVLVIDSCHLIYRDECLKYIMRLYQNCEEDRRPRILALTYPLFSSNKKDATQPKENNTEKDENKLSTINENDDISEVNLKTDVGDEKQTENDESLSNKDDKNEDLQTADTDESKRQNENIESKNINVNRITDSKSDVDSVKSESNLNETSDNVKNIDSIATADKKDEGKPTDTEENSNKMGLYENLDDFSMYEKLEWKIEELEKELCCQMDLAEDIDGGKRLSATLAKPKELIIEYSQLPPEDQLPEDHVALKRFMIEEVDKAVAFIEEHRYDPTEIYGEDMYEEFKNIPDPTIEPKYIFKQFLYILDELGPYAADKAAFCLLAKLEKLKIKVPYERHFLLLCLCTTVFVKIRSFSDSLLSKYESEWEKIRLFSTPKVLRLAEILEKFQPSELVKDGNKNTDTKNVNDTDTTPTDNVNITTDVNQEITNTSRDTKNNVAECINVNNQYKSKETNERNVNIDVNKIDKKLNNENKRENKNLESKTNKMLQDLDKCDFKSLGNKIEDRVNTIEGNLKDLDEFSYKETYSMYDNTTAYIIEEITDETEESVKKRFDKINREEKEAIKSKSDDQSITEPNNDKNAEKHEEKVKGEEMGPQKGLLGFPRRQGRTRGRGRVQRNNNARIMQNMQNPDALCGIVFMKDALMAKVMFMVVADMSRAVTTLSHITAQYCAEDSGPGEPRDCQRQAKRHEDVLKKFRMHECNLLLATSSLEEGIDLPRCNLVLRWDLPPSYRSYGLCRSRARAVRASCALLSGRDTDVLLHNVAVYREIDQIISRKCGCGIQDEPPQSEEDHADSVTLVVKPYTPTEMTDENQHKTYKVVDTTETIDTNNEREIIKDEEVLIKVTDKTESEIFKENVHECKSDAIESHNDSEVTSKNNVKVKTDIPSDVNNIKKEITELENIVSELNIKDNKLIDINTKTSNNETKHNHANSKIPKNNDNFTSTDNSNLNKYNSVNNENNITPNSVEVCIDNKKCVSKTEDIASVDLSSAIALINRYCGKLPSDTFTRLAPQWWMEEVQLPVRGSTERRTAYICTLRLPLNCPVKYNIVGHPMPTRVLARRVAALQACRILHKSGELDNHLMPIGKEKRKEGSRKCASSPPPQPSPSEPSTSRAAVPSSRSRRATPPPPPPPPPAVRVHKTTSRDLFGEDSDDESLLTSRTNNGKENFKAAELECNTMSAGETDAGDAARPGTTKRRQYYYKRTAWAFTDCQPVIDTTDSEIDPTNGSYEKKASIVKQPSVSEPKNVTKRNMLYAIVSSLWCALPERYNTRGRRLHLPQHAGQAIGILMARQAPDSLQIPAFPVYTRSGEVRVSVEHVPDADVRMSPRRAKLVRRFMRFVFAEVLRVRRRGMKLHADAARHNNYYIVPTMKVQRADGSTKIDIDWAFLELIYEHTEEKKRTELDRPPLWKQDDEDSDADIAETEDQKEKEKDNKVKKMDNPLLKAGETFVFHPDKYKEAVVTPWYRNQDQPQFFLVAEICWNLTPDSAFPSLSHPSFRAYYQSKYGVTLTQSNQPLLDVDHTSARLNLLTPRYVNRKGVALPVSSERTRRAKRDRLDQKQILVPELCRVHPFAAPLWFATVALPCVLYRINALLIADEIRRAVAIDVGLGIPKIDEETCPGFQWPPLDFGWSLAEVLSADSEKLEKKKEEDSKKEQKDTEEKIEIPTEDKSPKQQEPKEKTLNDILQEKEVDGGFEIGTWSNDMAASIPQTDEYDEYMEPLPSNLTFCTSASGGANWCDPIERPKNQYNPTKTYSMADSDCSYISSDFDTDDSDLNSDESDEDTDTSGFCSSKNSNAAMGVRIEYKTAHEAEAVDVERKKVNPAPQPDEEDDAEDRRRHEAVVREGDAPTEYIEKFHSSVEGHKKDILEKGHLIYRNQPVGDILPEPTKEQEKIAKVLEMENIARNLSKINLKNDNSLLPKSNKEIRNDNSSKLNPKSDSFSNKKSESHNLSISVAQSDNSVVITANDDLNNKNYNFKDLAVDNAKSDISNINRSNMSKENNDLSAMKIKIDESSNFSLNLQTDEITKEMIDEIFPFGNVIELDNGQITLESIERNKRLLLDELKKSLPADEIKKMNCFSMIDVDIDSPNYVNEKVVNVGFDTKDKYLNKINQWVDAKEFKPYYLDNKGKKFDFDHQPELEGHPGPSPSVILQALTMSNANDGINLERLETIGDSFLKFAITAYLYCAHPTVHEGKLSHMRSKQVSNLNLYRLGRNKRLGARMIASKFEPHDNWLPPCHKPPPTLHHKVNGDQQELASQNPDGPFDSSGCFIPYNLITQHSIPDKSIADCVEALIGAYLLECGPRGALLFMSWLGIVVLPTHEIPLPPDHPYVVSQAASNEKPEAPPSPSPCERWASSSESSGCDDDEEHGAAEEPPPTSWGWPARPPGARRPYCREDGQWVQQIYGELKAPPSPLLRYIEDPEGELERMLSGYDALERTLQYRFKDRSLLLQALTHASHQQNRLTDCYQRLEFLGDAILDYLITRHLYEDARRHSPGALTDLRSALVNNTIFATLAARHGFHKYFRHMSPGLNEVLTKYVKIQEENGHSISEEHYLIQEDEMEQAEDVEVPKALGDLFESVAGAIFLDSGMSLGAVWRSYVNLMGAELEAFSAAAPKSPVRELLEAEPDTAKFGKPERLADGRRVRVCVEVFGRGTFKGIGRNYRIAKGTAARCALRHLRSVHKR